MKNCIIISSHCDDAALSLGGALINKILIPKVVINVFTKTNWAIGGEGDVRQITKLRTKEDAEVFKILKINTKYVKFSDATLRKTYRGINDKYLDKTLDPTTDPIWNELVELVSDLYEEYKEIDNWFFPLGLGNHIDHRIIREVAIRNKKLLNQKNLYFYEDVGYDDTESEEKVRELIKTIPLILNPKKLEYRNIETKLDLIKHYSSQIDAEMLSQVKRTYEKRGYAERVWCNSIINQNE